MRIYAVTNGVEKEAYRLSGAHFKCFPRSDNGVANAREFATIEEAAIFMIKNPGWGIRMNPGSAIIYNGIQIEL
ncbi:hypothetical protein NKI56_18070 [Mesorhizobium sp. M0622]|uniref:hypothetical protein n=1 Tax=Mesorhizobium sp. M0622 TaxID=2956975 RepID=UPI003338826D